MTMKEIKVEEYNQEWKLEFKKAKLFYEELLIDMALEIVHVGSTSIEGLWSKPILDIDIIVRDETMSKKVIKRLQSVGYIHQGNLGVEGREAFKYSKENCNLNWMAHHLYVCIKGNENLKNHLLLQKHLRKNKESVKKYSALKRELAKKYPNDIISYIDGKTELILSFLKAEGMNLEEISRIESVNKKE